MKIISLIPTHAHFLYTLKITSYSKGNKTVPVKVATTHTEDGHKQDT